MVRSIGIDPGDRAVKVVELDGSYRKTRLVSVQLGPVPAPGADPMRPDLIAEAAHAAIEEHKMRGDITLGHPCREAVLRNLEVPFKGYDAIRKVVKAEIEGEIYTHSVDDMVVDFHEVGTSAEGGTKVMVASVPKAGLRNVLGALATHAIEPEFVDLDTMALWRVAHWAGVFDAEDAAAGSEGGEVGKGALSSSAGGAPITAVVDLGARSVKVVLVEGGNLVEMRALRLGDHIVVDRTARQLQVAPEQVRLAVEQSLADGVDVDVDVDVAAPAAVADPAATAADVGALTTTHRVVVRHGEVEQAHTGYLQRLARELTRFLTACGLGARVRSLWITGGGCRNQAACEMLAAVFGVQPKELDLLGRLSHDLEPDEAEALAPRIATALGLALGRLGGPEGLQLRQEDLALVRGFERLKFPLAITCIVAMLALWVYANRLSFELRNLQYELGQEYINPQNPKQVVFHGLLYPLFRSDWLKDPNHFRIDRTGKDYVYDDLIKELLAAPVHKRVQIVHQRLKAAKEQKQKESGIFENVQMPSGLAVLVRWAEVLTRIEPQLGRYLVPRLDLQMQGKSPHLEFTVAFRGSDFRARMSVLRSAFEQEYNRPDTPFLAPERSNEFEQELPFTDAEERDQPGSYYKVSVAIKPNFEPFGPSGNSVGAVPTARAPVEVASATGAEGK